MKLGPAQLRDPENIEIARSTPAGWAWYTMRGSYRLAEHLELVNEAICECIEQDDGRLIIEMPPRHGKSELAVIATVGWFLGLYPNLRAAVGTGALSLAKRHGRFIRNRYREHAPAVWGTSIDPANDSVVDFGILGEDGRPTGGGFRAYGMGSQFAGEGADLLVLDDLVPDREAADSPTIRENTWSWVEDVAWTRLEKGASVIAIMTRWHEDDVHGRLRERMRSEGWRIIRLPAISEGAGDPALPEGAPGEPDPLGRPAGAALWPWKYTEEKLRQIEAGRSSRSWNALYQQRPTALEGGVWKLRWWRRDPETGAGEDRTFQLEDVGRGLELRAHDGYMIPVAHMHRFVVVDLATTEKKSADYTAIGVFGLTTESPRRLAILDLYRRQMEGPDINPTVRALLNKWNARVAWYEVEGQQATVIQFARRAGIPAKSLGRAVTCDLQIAGDKVHVAEEATPLAASGRLLVPVSHPFLADWEHEMLVFPNGTNDDLEDITAWACHIAERAPASLLTGSPSAEAARSKESKPRVLPPRRRGDALDDYGPEAP